MTQRPLVAGLTTFISIAFCLAQGASATDAHDTVHTGKSGVAVNTFGKCVRTKWDAPSDECAPATPKKMVAAPAPRHAELAKAERTVYFGFNKAEITENGKQILDSLASKLKASTDVKQARVVGFADRIGSDSYNEKLSQKRAETVSNYLVSKGFAKMGATETRWLGETAPKTECAESMKRAELVDCLAKDRRVEVEIDYETAQ